MILYILCCFMLARRWWGGLLTGLSIVESVCALKVIMDMVVRGEGEECAVCGAGLEPVSLVDDGDERGLCFHSTAGIDCIADPCFDPSILSLTPLETIRERILYLNNKTLSLCNGREKAVSRGLVRFTPQYYLCFSFPLPLSSGLSDSDVDGDILIRTEELR